MDKQFDLIGIGECLIEFYEIGPHSYKQSVAGDVFNTLFYGSRLGLRTGFISNFGSDELTKYIREVMDREGIDRNCTSYDENKTNGLYLISNKGVEPYYAFWRSDSAAKRTLQTIAEKKLEAYILSSRYFHFSAIILAVLRERELLISLLQKVHGNVIISFDTNVRKGLWDDVLKLKRFIEKSSHLIDILFVSKSDDESIFGKRTPEVLLDFYSGLGYKTVILRQGADDVIVFTPECTMHIPVLKGISIVDTTAAGDAFNAGFIASQIRGENMENSIRHAIECAAFVIGRQGALAEDFHLRKKI
jgi:2-dehydro-3-deoxygluconokinase